MSNSEVNPHRLEEKPNLLPWMHTHTAQDGTRPQLTAEEFQTMCDDLHTNYYLPPIVQRFLRRTHIALKRVLQRDNTLESGVLEAANNLLNAMEGWLPLSFGNGFISIEVDYIGTMGINLCDSETQSGKD